MAEPTTPPAGGTDDAPATTPPAEPTPDPQTYSKEAVERIVNERLARQKAQFADYDDVKAKATQFDEQQAASATELEKAQGRAEKAEAERDDAVRRANASLLRATVVAEATKQGAVDPDAVVALLPADAVTIGDDDQITGVEEAVKGLLEAKPYLVGSTRPGPGDGGARPPATPSAGPGDPEQQHNQLVAGLFGSG